MDDYFAAAPAPAAAATPGPLPRPRHDRYSVRPRPAVGAAAVGVLVVVVSLARIGPLVSARGELSAHQILTPAPAAQGWGAEFADPAGRPGRLDPCLATSYAVNLAGAPPGALAVVRAAVSSLATATGLRFTYAGLTADRPATRHRPARAGDRPRLLIGWAAPGQPVDGQANVAAVTYTRAVPTARGPVIVGADILVNADRVFAEAGAATHESLRLVLLHELGHAAGLRHVEGSGQVMGAVAHPWLTDYASGDQSGLRILGSGSCLPLQEG